MSTTLANLRSDLRTELRIDPNDKIWPTNTKDKYLNRAYRQVQKDGQYNWRQNQVEFEFTLTSGTEKYDLGTIISTDNFVCLDFIQLKDSLTNLHPTSLDVIRTRGSSDTGQPNEYFIYGSDLGFYPKPDAGYTVLMLYRKKLAKLSSSQDLELPDDFADAVVKYAAYIAWSSPRGEKNKAIETLNDYKEALAELKMTYLLQDRKQLKFGYQRSAVNDRSDKALYYD